MTISDTYPDACQICPPPFDVGACPAIAMQGSNGGIVTAHECAVCGSTWRTWRDMHGWPVVRLLDPVSPAQAVINRGVLLEALDEQKREARHAAA